MAARKKHLMEVTLGSRRQEIKLLLKERRLALETRVFNWLISWYSRLIFWARMENKVTTYVGYSIQSPTSWWKTPNRQRHLHKQLISLFRNFRSTVGKKLPIKTASGSVEMKLSNGKRDHTMKRDLDPSSSGSHSCSEHKGCSLQYTCLIEFTKQSNSTQPGVRECHVKVMGDSRTQQHLLKMLMMWSLFPTKISCLVLQRIARLPKKCQEVWLLHRKQKTNNTWCSIYLKSQLRYITVNGLCWSPFQRDQIGTKKELQWRIYAAISGHKSRPTAADVTLRKTTHSCMAYHNVTAVRWIRGYSSS